MAVCIQLWAWVNMKGNAKSAHHLNCCASLADVDMNDLSQSQRPRPVSRPTNQFNIKIWSVGRYGNSLVLLY